MYKPQPNLMVLKPKSEAMLGEFPAEKRFVSEVKYPEEGGILSYFQMKNTLKSNLYTLRYLGFLTLLSGRFYFLQNYQIVFSVRYL
jgi:hypothetical protein